MDDKEQEELRERRLVDRVASEARSRLFGSYIAIGAVVMSLLGYIGYNILGNMEAAAVSTASQRVDQIAKERIDPLVTHIEERLAHADESLRHTERLLDQSQNRMQLSDDLTAEMRSKTQRLVENSEEARQKAQVALQTLDKEMTEAARKIDQLEQALEDNRIRFESSFADAGSVHQVLETLDGLITQVRALGTRVEVLEGDQPTPSPDSSPEGVDDYSGETLSGLLENTQAQLTTLQAPVQVQVRDHRTSATAGALVFFQFSILPREQARQIAQLLRDQGYSVPGEERVPAADGLHEVRYYYSHDQVSAETLADKTNQILSRLGWSDLVIAVRDLTGLKAAKPRQGVLELWLGIQPYGGGKTR
jgi:hypothetical protein